MNSFHSYRISSRRSGSPGSERRGSGPPGPEGISTAINSCRTCAFAHFLNMPSSSEISSTLARLLTPSSSGVSSTLARLLTLSSSEISSTLARSLAPLAKWSAASLSSRRIFQILTSHPSSASFRRRLSRRSKYSAFRTPLKSDSLHLFIYWLNPRQTYSESDAMISFPN